MRDKTLSQTTDWTTIGIYFLMVFLGWINIYAAVYDPESDQGLSNLFSFDYNSGKQLIWISVCIFLIAVIMLLDFRIYRLLAYPGYIVSMLSLVAVMFLARDIKGAQSWLEFGGVRLQPSEFAKLATALALAKFIDTPNVKLSKFLHHVAGFIIMAIPMALIVLQGDAGSALVFGAFVLVMYREGLPPIYLIIGLSVAFFFVLTLFLKSIIIELTAYLGVGLLWGIIIGLGILALVLIILIIKKKKSPRALISIIVALYVGLLVIFSMNLLLTYVFQPHQTLRLEVLIDPELDPQGKGYQVNQSKIAIGSGGLLGKGFLEGTQTKLDFVPDQSTDFIFCTVGEEHGWLGSLVVVALFTIFIYRLIALAERQKSPFGRAYGYAAASIFFLHFMINIGMTIGLFPVIGIPLPFFSYGGSSLISFTVLLFVLIKIDSHRMQVLGR